MSIVLELNSNIYVSVLEFKGEDMLDFKRGRYVRIKNNQVLTMCAICGTI